MASEVDGKKTNGGQKTGLQSETLRRVGAPGGSPSPRGRPWRSSWLVGGFEAEGDKDETDVNKNKEKEKNIGPDTQQDAKAVGEMEGMEFEEEGTTQCGTAAGSNNDITGSDSQRQMMAEVVASDFVATGTTADGGSAGAAEGVAGSARKRTDITGCLLYTSPSPRDLSTSRMPSSA